VRRRCFFHAGCPDGFGAAWAVWRAWGAEGSYVPRGHDDTLEPADHVGELLVFVDIAPPIRLLPDLAGAAARVVVLDHHVSARDLYARDPGAARVAATGHHLVHFDLQHSGAILAWNHFHPETPPPELLRYVEDQDLWSWKLPRSEEVNATIGSYPRDFGTWEELAARPIEELSAEGEPIVRAIRIDVGRALETAQPIRIGDRLAEAVNSRHNRALIGHELAKRAAFDPPWGVVYRIAGDRVDVSLYSVGDLDVSKIAEEYGGGGHRNASGFSVPLRVWLERFLTRTTGRE
jgi:hypothetical protein